MYFANTIFVKSQDCRSCKMFYKYFMLQSFLSSYSMLMWNWGITLIYVVFVSRIKSPHGKKVIFADSHDQWWDFWFLRESTDCLAITIYHLIWKLFKIPTAPTSMGLFFRKWHNILVPSMDWYHGDLMDPGLFYKQCLVIFLQNPLNFLMPKMVIWDSVLLKIPHTGDTNSLDRCG